MDHLEHAKKLYRKCHDHADVISADDLAMLSVSITKLIRTCLTQQGGVTSFKYSPFIHVIKKTVGSNRFQSDRAAMAFTTLEKYLLLLVAQPWKREFWLLKTYGGYFCTKVKAHLEDPEAILELVGYTKEEGSCDNGCIVLDRPPDPDIVLNVAFDCQVAAVECLFIGEYHEKMKCVGLSLSEAMNVLLSGAPNDPVLDSPVVVLPGKSMQAGNNHYVNTKLDLSKSSTASRLASLAGSPQMIMAAGGMGMGVVTEVNATTHQVAGLQPRLMGTSAPLPYTSIPDVPAGGLKVDLPVLRHPQEHGGRPPSIASQVAGSRASYSSSACAPSSGYGSEVPSVLSTPSSAYTASSGYSSGAPSQAPAHTYTYPQEGRVRDQVDSPLPAQHGISHRHSRQHPLPQQQQPANFPFIDEDDPSASSPFPEGTHEEHLRESLRNLQGVHVEKNRSKMGQGVAPATSQMGRRQGRGGTEGVAVTYDDWQWFHKSQGAPPSYDTVAGTGGTRAHQSSSSVIIRHAHHAVDVLRSTHSQPATAVTAMLTQKPMMDLHQQRALSANYPPFTVGNVPAAGPLSESDSPRDRPVINSNPVSNNMAHGRIGPSPQTVYYPPAPEDAAFQHYTTSMAGPPLQQRHMPTFTSVVSARRSANNSALLSRQAQVSGTTVLNDLDKDHPGKALNVGQEGTRSSPEVVMRDKVLSKLGNMRSSSLVSPHTTSIQGAGYTRQSSRSMDMGMLKWKCQTCTMENSVLDSICTACSKSRDAPDMQFPAAGESKLMCPSCTFENPPGHIDCEVCGNTLPQDIHTYV